MKSYLDEIAMSFPIPKQIANSHLHKCLMIDIFFFNGYGVDAESWFYLLNDGFSDYDSFRIEYLIQSSFKMEHQSNSSPINSNTTISPKPNIENNTSNAEHCQNSILIHKTKSNYSHSMVTNIFVYKNGAHRCCLYFCVVSCKNLLHIIQPKTIPTQKKCGIWIGWCLSPCMCIRWIFLSCLTYNIYQYNCTFCIFSFRFW